MVLSAVLDLNDLHYYSSSGTFRVGDSVSADMFQLTTAFNDSRFSEEVFPRPPLAIFTPAVQRDLLFEFRRPALGLSISRSFTMLCTAQLLPQVMARCD